MHKQDTYMNFIDPEYRVKVCLGACLESQKKRRLPWALANPPLALVSWSLHECNDA